MRTLFTLLLAILFSFQSNAQSTLDSLGFETFEMTEGDTTYTMKKYFMVFLKSGDNRNHSKEEAAQIQAGHLAHLGKLGKEGKICIAGPFDDDGNVRGIVVFNVPTKEEVEMLVSKDPALQAGRLTMEIHPWWAAKGSVLE